MYDIDEIVEFCKLLNSYTILTNSNVREKFLNLYGYTFDEYPSCVGCADEIEQAIIKFMWIVKKHKAQNITQLMKANQISKYTMKEKIRIYSSSLRIMVTQYNCTDEIAEVLMKENPSCKDVFIVNQLDEPKPIETYSVINPDESEEKVIVVENKKKAGRKKKNA
jgi:hypothetical protein